MTSKKTTEVVLLRLSVKSNHPNTDTAMILEAIDGSKADLKKTLARRVPVRVVSFARRGNYPIGLETAIITVLVTIGTEAGKAIIKEAAEDAYKWFKGRWEHARIKKLPLPADSKSTSGKTRKTKTKRTQG